MVWLGVFSTEVWSRVVVDQEVLRYTGMSFQGLSVQQGLSQVSANAVLQSSRGYIWIGTQDGLNRYDGHEIRVFRHDKDNPQSLARDFINALAEDSRGHLWVGTKGRGLDEYDPVTETFRHHRLVGAENSKGAFDIRTLAVEGNQLLVGTLQGLFSLDLSTRQIRVIDKDWGRPTVYAFQHLQDDSVLIASNLGLHRYDPATRTVTPAYRALLESFPGTVRALLLDSRNRLWVGIEERGVLLIDPTQGTLLKRFERRAADDNSITSMVVSSFTEDFQHNVWLGSATGINVYIDSSDRMIRIVDARKRPEGMHDQSVNSLYTDRNGTVWISTHVGGASHVTPHLVRFGTINPTRNLDTYDRRILGVDFTVEGDMFLGSTVGLLRRRAGQKEFELVPMAGQTPAHSRPAVYGVFVSQDGTVWAGAKGLRRLPPGKDQLGLVEVESSGYILALLEDQKGYLWLGLPTELVKYDPATRKIVARLEIPQIYALCLLDSGELLVGSLSSIHLLDTSSTRVLSTLDGENEGFNTVTYLYQDWQGDIWAGTQGDGLLHLKLPTGQSLAGSQLEFYTTKQGLLSNAIGSIQQSDDGNLWVSTINSISRLDPDTGEIRNFNAKDGAFSGDYFVGSGNQDSEGFIYFGGAIGLNQFSPDWIQDDNSNPKAILTQLRLDNLPMLAGAQNSPLQAPLAYTRQLSIPPRWTGFSLMFSSDNYTFPSAQRFSYRLVGVDDAWTETDVANRVASYSSLPPGTYRFQVRASNLDGHWSKHLTELEITLLPSWYQTVWGWLLLLVAGGTLIYAIVRWRMAGLLRRNLELEKSVQKRTHALIQANEKLSHLARTDTLTGLFNRRAFNELYNHFSSPDQTAHGCVLALLDIDFFKLFNDKYGHDCGDAVLKEIALLLKADLRENDIVARWGGEEFILLLPDIQRERATEVMERLRQSIAAFDFEWNGAVLRITVTIGVGNCIGKSLDASLKAVDEALFKGKAQGRNRVVVVSEVYC